MNSSEIPQSDYSDADPIAYTKGHKGPKPGQPGYYSPETPPPGKLGYRKTPLIPDPQGEVGYQDYGYPKVIFPQNQPSPKPRR